MVKILRNLPSLLIGGLLFMVCALSIFLAFWIPNFGPDWLRSIGNTPEQVVSITGTPPGLSSESTETTRQTNQPSPSTLPSVTSSPSPTPTITPTPTPTPDPWIDQQIARLTLEEKIGQMLMIGVDGLGSTDANCSLVQRLSPGGVIFRRGNTVNPVQLREFSRALQDCSASGVGLPLFISIDHEGQYVTRYSNGVTVFPAALAQGATGNTEYAYQVARAAGGELAYSGVNMVLGPVADVLTNYDNTVISQRAFGGDPDLVGAFVGQAVQGYMAAGVMPVLKHFPGHGGVPGDTHYNVVSDAVDPLTFEQVYLPPFLAGMDAGAPVVMFGHVAYPQVEESIAPSMEGNARPASLSPGLGLMLREELGFTGIIMTDSMGMAAISGSTRDIADAAVQAVLAGEDMLLTTSPSTAQAAFNGILEAVQSGAIPAERIDGSARRILELKVAWNLKSFPNPDTSVPDWSANAELNRRVGRDAVAVLSDTRGLVPLPSEPQRILIIGPTDGWGLYPVLESALAQQGHTFDRYVYSTPWNGPVPESGYLESLPALAKEYDLTLVLTWEAHLNRLRYSDTWQAELVNRLLSNDVSLVVVALKSPTDLLEFPQVGTYLATFGTTSGQIQGLAEVLAGVREPVGINPLPGLVESSIP